MRCACGLCKELGTFLRDRVAKIRAFRGRAQRLWDSSILRMLLK